MAIWKDPAPAAKASEPARFELGTPEPQAPAEHIPAPAAPAPIRAVETAARESVIAADLTIEGKIEGAGHVRIAGKFKGDIKVQGNLTIDQGAKVSGGVSANKVTLAGELDGNITSAQQVDVLPSGAINGDLKAGSLTVAAGSRIRGHVECGWGKDDKPAAKTESGSAA
ncbi:MULTISPECIES: bactofilin family protein [Thermomonas]|jgi:cytoskeletal protein CcmA (bactofilin family)|uniref:Polymer-forming cytoskeletal protein n=1 Tax=Thermomonas fusca TaxID=215690 RepID=A0A5R9PCF7_9GAMM|nr:polymer-forming cytoskeletal protein [Thermomonas fusca]